MFELFILSHIKNYLTTNDNQFGFKEKHGTDMCVFLLKQTISYYVQNGSPVFSVFLDASKAFDRVNHNILYKKLILRNVPMCFVRLLHYWYSSQCMYIKWKDNLSNPFKVSNGVRQGGILSPYLFALYIDELSCNLNKITTGCLIGDACLNHLMFADDICCFSPSAKGLQKLINVCELFALSHNIIFNINKTRGVYFPTKRLQLDFEPTIVLNCKQIKFSSSVLYLGVHINNTLLDDMDINRQVRSLYCIANRLRRSFSYCSNYIKNILFRSYCTSMYSCQLWCNYHQYSMNRIRVAYNNTYRILHNIARNVSVKDYQIKNNIPTFDALIRKLTFLFNKRCVNSCNTFIKSAMTSDCYYKSTFTQHYYDILYAVAVPTLNTAIIS